jgi:hypothetical protein
VLWVTLARAFVSTPANAMVRRQGVVANPSTAARAIDLDEKFWGKAARRGLGEFGAGCYFQRVRIFADQLSANHAPESSSLCGRKLFDRPAREQQQLSRFVEQQLETP